MIATLATAVGATRELVEELLRVRLRHPENPSRPAIDVFLSPLSDFIDVASLIRKLSADSDATSIGFYLWGKFSQADQLVLRNSGSTFEQMQVILVSVLNPILNGPSIYDEKRFRRVTLSAETTALDPANAAVTGKDLIRLNRLLLEDAFPLEIAKRRSDDMLFVAGEVAEAGSLLVQGVLLRLYKSALISDALKLSRTDFPLLRKGPTDDTGLSSLDFNSLPVAPTDPTDVAKFEQLLTAFEQLLALVQLRGIARGAGDMLHQYAALNFAHSTAVPWTTAAANQVLKTGLNINVQDVKNAAKQLHITTAEQYRDPIVLKQLIELIVVLKQLGTTMEAVYSSSAPSLTTPNGFASASPNDRDADAARELLRAKYGESQWHDLIKPIADKLRERQRDALLDYLIAQSSLPRASDSNPQLLSGPRLRDANDVYEFYLIDVQTSSCLKTTRLLQATGAVQLFIQRLLLNLEHNLSLTEDKRALWDWMHNYRVWEANRKVFLYPENWLLPELRDDKTSTFDKMESAFTEGEPAGELIRAALLGYVEDLGDLAQMNVIAMYADNRTVPDESGKNVVTCTLYVIGRTPDQPYQYHWRSCTNFGSGEMSWSGWEALDLDNANDFIMPFVFEGDLHVAWPVFRETKDEKDESKLWWQVQLAWARHTSKGWVKRKIGEAQVALVERLPNKEALDSFTFRLKKEVSNLPFGDQTLSQETIGISIYAAGEMGDTTDFTPTFRPDPLLIDVNDSDPVPSNSLTKGDWNTYFSVAGVAYEYATVDQATRYRPLSGMTIDIQYWTKSDEFGATFRNPYST
ncbi:MAG TPA: neuraminidase-like domain-containing protein, partial [Pyrinomonadaceae bacterium]